MVVINVCVAVQFHTWCGDLLPVVGFVLTEHRMCHRWDEPRNGCFVAVLIGSTTYALQSAWIQTQ